MERGLYIEADNSKPSEGIYNRMIYSKYEESTITDVSEISSIRRHIFKLTIRCVTRLNVCNYRIPYWISTLYFVKTHFSSSLPELPPYLRELICTRNILTELPTLPNTLQMLSCNNNDLRFLPNLSTSLRYLDCNDNKLQHLPTITSESLIHLSCTGNKLKYLPAMNHLSQLTKLCVDNNNLQELPDLRNCTSLIILRCTHNFLKTITNLPSGLQILECGFNTIQSLTGLPDSILRLHCSSNELSSIEYLPKSLIILECSLNYLKCLPTLPERLHTIHCEYNELKSLPILPENLSELYCSHNNLTKLPRIPLFLECVDCSYNYLTELPNELSNFLKVIICNNNRLTNLPSIPSSLRKINYTNNTKEFPYGDLLSISALIECQYAHKLELTITQCKNKAISLVYMLQTVISKDMMREILIQMIILSLRDISRTKHCDECKCYENIISNEDRLIILRNPKYNCSSVQTCEVE